MFERIMLFFFILGLNVSYAVTPVSLDLQNINLPDAIHSLAQLLDQQVIISKTVQGSVSLYLQNEAPAQAFNALLTANGLAAWKLGRIWWIAPRDEFIKRKQEEFQWQTVLSETAALKVRTWPIHYAKADDIAHLLQNERNSFLSKRGQVRADPRTNRIFVQDTVSQLERINQLIQDLDVPVAQIAIEARLASVDSDYERELGLHFTTQAGKANVNPQQGQYSLAIASLADASLLDIKLSALENAGHAKLISSPSLFTANQQTASIEAGEEVPYQEVSESGGTAIVFKKAVLGLKVTPQVLPGNKVLLQLQISQDRPSSKMVLGMPTISTREISSNVLVKHGQTIVLGGIYELDAENTEQRLPFLSQLPVIGLLFKQQNTRQTKRELLIFVTPKVIA